MQIRGRRLNTWHVERLLAIDAGETKQTGRNGDFELRWMGLTRIHKGKLWHDELTHEGRIVVAEIKAERDAAVRQRDLFDGK